MGDKTGGRVRAFLIDGAAAGFILIDSLLRPDGKLVLDALHSLGRKPTDIKHIILTHAHQSHMGGIGALAATSGAKVYAHEFEADVLAGRRPYDIAPGLGFWPRKPVRTYPYQLGFVLRVRMPPPLEVDQTLRDGDHVGPLQVLHSPGHSRGSLSFWWPERRILIVGDAVATWPGLMLGWASINFDEKTNHASMAKLCDLSSAELLCVGHGDPVVEGGAETLRDLVAGRPVQPTIASMPA